MPRKFRRNKPIRTPRETVYLKNPVGSNEWYRLQRIKFTKSRDEADQKRKELRENSSKGT